MPNIPEFEARAADAGLRPQEGGAEAFAREGQHIESVYQRLGSQLGGGIEAAGQQWEKHVTVQADLTTLKQQTQKLVARQGEWAQAMAADAAAPVHNPNLLQDFQTKWAKEDDDYNANLPTEEAKQFHAEQAARQRQHFAETGMADMGSLAGHQAVLDHQQLGVYNQTAAYNDPTSANHARGTMDAALEAEIRSLGPNATPEAINVLRTENVQQQTAITLAQARGVVDHAVDPVGSTPGAGIKPAISSFLESPEAKLYLNEAQRAEIESYADRQTHAKTQDQWMQEEHQHRQAEWTSQATVGQYQKVLGDSLKPGGSLPADFLSTVLADKTLTPADRDTLVGLTHRMQTEAANTPTANGLLHTMLGRVVLPENDPHRLTANEVMQHIGVDLSKSDGDFLLERLKPAAETHDRMANIMLEQTLREARAKLVPHDQLAGLDPSIKASEEHNASNFETWFIGAYQDGLKGGKTPEQLLSPTSPDYLLKGDRIQSFVPTTAPAGPAPGSNAAPLGGSPGPGGFPAPQGKGFWDQAADFLNQAGTTPEYRGLGPPITGDDLLHLLGLKSGNTASIDQDRMNQIRRQAAALGQRPAPPAGPAPGTAGATVVAPGAQPATLSQDQVDSILFGKK